MNKGKLVFILPFVLLLGFLVVAFGKLQTGEMPHNTAQGRNLPALHLPRLDDDRPLQLSDIEGQVTLVNFFASWCTPCIAEHAFLKSLQGLNIPIIGIVYKDNVDAARNFLKRHGNPYKIVGLDANGEGAIEWGITGVPETFLIGANGTILAHRAGPLTEEIWAGDFAPHLKDGAR